MKIELQESPACLDVDFRAPTFSGLKLGKKTIEALESMAHEGLSLHEAAKRHDMRRDNLRRAFERPQVKAVYNDLVAFVRDNGAQSAYLRIVELSQTAKSETVRLEACKWLAGVDGLSPVKRADLRHVHNVTFKGFDYGDMAKEPQRGQ